MIRIFDCELEIDTERGVIYAHNKDTGQTILRICSLPKPIKFPTGNSMLDITFGYGVNWSKDS